MARQKRLGPAPMASLDEDLSDESKSNAAAALAAGVANGGTASLLNLLPCSAPRIDISRASSSSNKDEDSRGSTPERELFQGSALGAAFSEDGALELRSSTEELDYCPRPDDGDLDTRRGSDVHVQPLLSVSGRTSRLSSVGSQGSRASDASHLSVTSHVSSRSPSPHKMLLETSFCGPKTSEEVSEATNVLLSRHHDPTEAVLAEGISIEARRKLVRSPRAPPPPPRNPKAQQEPSKAALTATAPAPAPAPATATVKERPEEKKAIATPSSPRPEPGGVIVADSGVEYTFIPLRGPLPRSSRSLAPTPKASRHHRTATNAIAEAGTSNSRTKRSDEPKYIRIKLKPDHMYDDGPNKPTTLDLKVSEASHHKAGTVESAVGNSIIKRAETKIVPANLKQQQTASPINDLKCKSSPTPSDTKHAVAVSNAIAGPVRRPAPSNPRKSPRPTAKLYESILEGESIVIPLHSPTDRESTHEPVKESAQSVVEVVVIKEVPPETQPVPPPETQPVPPPETQPVPPLEAQKEPQNKLTESPVEAPKINKPPEVSAPHEPPVKPPPGRVIVKPPRLSLEQKSKDVSKVEPPIDLSDDDVDLNEHAVDYDDEIGVPEEDEAERRALVVAEGCLARHQDSLDDELPYVPTTLPQERSVAVPMVPVRDRQALGLRGAPSPLERPRPSGQARRARLDDYCAANVSSPSPSPPPQLRIQLPRGDDSVGGSGGGPRAGSASPPPPLPPRAWVNFEDIPERRKAPKRIQTVPMGGPGGVVRGPGDSVVYTYVNPEDCRCECHEAPTGHAR